MKKLLLALLVAFAIQSCGNSNSEKTLSVHEQFQQSVDQVNAELPVMVDQFTRFDSMALGHSKNILYYYTLVGLDLDSIVANVDTITMDDFKEAMTFALSENVINSPEMAFYRENNATLNYVYFNEKGKEQMRVSFGPNDYEH